MTPDGYILKLIADLLAANEQLASENTELRAQLVEAKQEGKPE